ncbi:MAG: 50S ribosome-binding GTPase [Kiritimatiellae bacterium]|nr:50S ribosome-binding GTPase [Kiritimatiellia bacterium]
MENGRQSDWNSFERALGRAYLRFAPLAERYYFSFRRRTVTMSGAPMMLFLGNHSSGKSTLINWLVGGEQVQDTGLAPTDDGFTVITYADREEDVSGPAALARLPAEFAALATLGGSFLQRLTLKFRRRELLKSVTLIDSPGMIDSADAAIGRTYDFDGAVRILANVSDMVFFLLDPDKPGTTGETVQVFSRCLRGMEFKLRVLLNKCDLFTGIYDFARTYGTVCWNLSRVLATKDLPKILTVYSGDERRETAAGFPLSDFNRLRNEFLSIVRDASSRRRDNIYSQSLSDFTGLSMRMCVVNRAWRHLIGPRIAGELIAVLLSAAAGIVAWLALTLKFSVDRTPAIASGAVVGALLLAASIPLLRLVVRVRRRALADAVDSLFAASYLKRVSVGSADDVRQAWSMVRDETAEVIRAAPLSLPLFGELRRRSLDRATRSLFGRK